MRDDDGLVALAFRAGGLSGRAAGAWQTAGAVAARPRFDSTNRHADTINYQLNAHTGQASWLTRDSSLDGSTSQFFAARRHAASFEFFPLSTVSGWAATAPVAPLRAPTVTLLSRSDQGGTSVVRIRLASRRHAPAIKAAVNTGSITAASIDGQPVA